MKIFVLHYQTTDPDDSEVTDVIEVFATKASALNHAETLLEEAAEDDDIAVDALSNLRKEGGAAFERYGIAHMISLEQKTLGP